MCIRDRYKSAYSTSSDPPVWLPMPAAAAQPSCAPAVYHRRQPQRTLLCRIVQAHLATWLALHDDGCGGHAPAITEREYRRYLTCDILAQRAASPRGQLCPRPLPGAVSYTHLDVYKRQVVSAVRRS